MRIIMLDTTPEGRFKLTQLDEFILVVLLIRLYDIENDVVVLVQKHVQK
jgi:hypothetical protein